MSSSRDGSRTGNTDKSERARCYVSNGSSVHYRLCSPYQINSKSERRGRHDSRHFYPLARRSSAFPRQRKHFFPSILDRVAFFCRAFHGDCVSIRCIRESLKMLTVLSSCTVVEINLLFRARLTRPLRSFACARWKARVGLFSKDRRDIFARELLCGARYNFLVVLCKKLSSYLSRKQYVPRRHALGSFLKGPREYRYQERRCGTSECVSPSEFLSGLSLERITRSLALFLSVNAGGRPRALHRNSD